MKTKYLMILAIIILFLAPVASASDPSKYVTIAPLTGTPYGTLNIHVLCQHNLFSKEIVMYQSGGNPLDNTTIQILPDGKFTGPFNPGKFDLVLLDGNGGHAEYRTVDIRAGQTATVWFVGHAVSMHAIKKNITPEPTPTPTVEPTIVPTPNETPSPTPTPTPTPTQCIPALNIVSAQYGFIGQDCRQVLVNASWNETVIDTPAYTQYQISTWQIVTPEVPAWIEYLGNAKRDGNSQSSNYKMIGQGADGADYALTQQSHSHNGNEYCHQHGASDNYACGHDGNYKLTNPGHIHHAKIPAVYGWVVTSSFQNGTCSASIACTPKPGDTKCEERTIPATYKEITHPAVYEEQCTSVGAMVDVTQNVKDVVSQGTTSFIFDNRPSPGGIFDITGTQLLSEITDPAYGYVKSVKITYNMGCDSLNKDITANEYEIITL